VFCCVFSEIDAAWRVLVASSAGSVVSKHCTMLYENDVTLASVQH
jgi:hypothetical protein